MVSRARRAIKKHLKGTGVRILLHARDLGVDASPGLRRTQIQKGRMAKALGRARMIRRLGIPALKVGKYTNMLVKSAAFFGVEVSGMARTNMKTLRAGVDSAVMPGRSTRTCPVTMLALKAGKGQALDPTVQVPTQVIGHWAERAWAWEPAQEGPGGLLEG